MNSMGVDTWIGKKVGRFIVTERLAVGGMSIVYRAFDTMHGKLVALKMLHDNYVNHLTVKARFAQEADLVQMLRHDNLVKVLETGKIDGRIYVAFALIDGGNLVHLLDAHRHINLGQSLRILTEIGAALDYIHSRNVIHRDLKLGNILVDSSNKAYLIDFGISRWLDVDHLTEADFNMPGTARYMPPEQVLGGMTFDHRADLYSLGVVAYVLTTGFFPFTGINDLVLMNQHLTMIPALPSNINPALSPSVNGVLYKAMSKKPENRYTTAAAFVEALSDSLRGTHDLDVPMHLKLENPGRLLPEYQHMQGGVFCDDTPPSAAQQKSDPEIPPRHPTESLVSPVDTGKLRKYIALNG